MPDDQTPSPAAGAVADPPAAASPQPAPTRPSSAREEYAFSNVFEGSDIPAGAGDDEADVSNGGNAADEPKAAAPASDAKPAPGDPEGVKASDAPGPGEGSDPPPEATTLSRREAERVAHQQRITELEARVQTFESPAYREQVRQEIAAEQQRQQAESVDEDFLGNEEQFQASVRLPDNDPRLNQLAPDGVSTLYDWREERKQRREQFSPIERHFRAIYDRKAAEFVQQTTAAAQSKSDQAVADGWAALEADMHGQIAASTKLPGVDASAFKAQGSNWQTMAEQIHAAGAAWKEAELADRVTKADAEVARLQQIIDELNSTGLASRRAPAVVGRSAGAAPNGNAYDPNADWRTNLVGAFGFDSNGTG